MKRAPVARSRIALAALLFAACKTIPGVDDKPIPHVDVPALAASPACPEAAQMLAAFHQGALKGPLAQVQAHVDDVLTRCPKAWEAHEVAALTARLADHDDDEHLHWMAATADLRAPPDDAQFFVRQISDKGTPVHLDRATLAFLRDVARAHPDPMTRAIAQTHLIDLAHDYEPLPDDARAGLGVIERWQLVGTFDNDQGKGFLTAYPPEEKIDLAAELKGRLLPVHWRKVDHLWPAGSVPVQDLVAPKTMSVAYLATWLRAPAARHARLLLGTDAAFRVFVNGRLVGEEQKVDQRTGDGFSIPIELNAGGNQLLIKSANEDGAWALRARLVDDTGAPLTDVVASDVPLAFTADARTGDAAKAHVDVLPLVKGDDARALFVRARSLAHAGLAREALETARKYADASKNNPLAVLMVSELLKRNQEAGKAIDLLNRNIGDDKNAPAAFVIDRAKFYASKKRFDAAQDDLRALLERDPAARDALVELAHVYDERNWKVDRCVLLDQGLARWPDSTTLLGEKADCMHDRGFRAEAKALYERAHAIEPGAFPPMTALANMAALADDLSEAERLYRREHELEPVDPSPLLELASLARRAGDVKGAHAWLDELMRINPEDERPYERLGDLAYENGDTKAALTLWKLALERNPDDNALAWHVDFVAGEGLGALAKYAPTRDDIERAIASAAAKPPAPGSNVVMLLDQTVTEVNADGSSRAVVTEVQQAVNQHGRDELITTYVPRDARILDVRSITPSGESQEASSISNGTIRFRKLDVGSVTVVQYVERTRAGGFLPNHYVSSFWFSGVQRDVRASSWTLIVPKNREVVRHVEGSVVKEAVAEAGDKRVYTWSAKDVPPLIPEPHMPPSSDYLARVHVSTLSSWDEYVKWEQALLKDAFRSNPEVDALAAKLLEGSTTKRDKIDRIFKYVSKDIRYQQEYETTIAGVKPHACPVVLERGYGDCKDKAVLLIMLLRKAGVDADFALLRTTDAGLVEKDVPNQQFNHAIVHVRKQDGIDEGFFTDATTDALDLGNLRHDDQGATSLVLDPDTGAWHFEQIPYQAPTLEYSNATVALDVTAAKAHIDIASRGAQASSQRRAVRDAETAKKLEQGWAAILWPGVTYTSGNADTSEDLSKPFTLGIDVDASAAIHDDADGKRIDVPHYSPFADLTKLSERKLPLKLGIPSSQTVSLTFALPAGKKLVRAPGDFHVEHACFTADRKTTTTSTSVSIVQSYTTTCPHIDASDYAAFRAKALEVVTRENDPLVLSK